MVTYLLKVLQLRKRAFLLRVNNVSSKQVPHITAASNVTEKKQSDNY